MFQPKGEQKLNPNHLWRETKEMIMNDFTEQVITPPKPTRRRTRTPQTPQKIVKAVSLERRSRWYNVVVYDLDPVNNKVVNEVVSDDMPKYEATNHLKIVIARTFLGVGRLKPDHPDHPEKKEEK